MNRRILKIPKSRAVGINAAMGLSNAPVFWILYRGYLALLNCHQAKAVRPDVLNSCIVGSDLDKPRSLWFNCGQRDQGGLIDWMRKESKEFADNPIYILVERVQTRCRDFEAASIIPFQ